MSPRILQEVLNFQKSNQTEIEMEFAEDSIDFLSAKINQTTGNYRGFSFELGVEIPEKYPNEPPKVVFKTRICHPNIHFESGEICLDLLTTNWSPVFTIYSTLEAINLLLDNPEPNSPLNVDAALLFRADQVGYKSLVRFYCREYASTNNLD